MKKQFSLWLSIAALGCLGIAAGCGGEPVAAENPTSPSADSEPAVAPPDPLAFKPNVQLPPADTSPDKVVGEFLESLRNGDEGIASGLLTSAARTATARENLRVQPPGTPQATYQIGQVDYVDDTKTGAHVHSVWSDSYDGNRTVSYNVTWVLRREHAGWRISGLATRPAPTAQAIFLNFEDPKDMIQKVHRADAELAEADPVAPKGTPR